MSFVASICLKKYIFFLSITVIVYTFFPICVYAELNENTGRSGKVNEESYLEKFEKFADPQELTEVTVQLLRAKQIIAELQAISEYQNPFLANRDQHIEQFSKALSENDQLLASVEKQKGSDHQLFTIFVKTLVSGNCTQGIQFCVGFIQLAMPLYESIMHLYESVKKECQPNNQVFPDMQKSGCKSRATSIYDTAVQKYTKSKLWEGKARYILDNSEELQHIFGIEAKQITSINEVLNRKWNEKNGLKSFLHEKKGDEKNQLAKILIAGTYIDRKTIAIIMKAVKSIEYKLVEFKGNPIAYLESHKMVAKAEKIKKTLGNGINDLSTIIDSASKKQEQMRMAVKDADDDIAISAMGVTEVDGWQLVAIPLKTPIQTKKGIVMDVKLALQIPNRSSLTVSGSDNIKGKKEIEGYVFVDLGVIIQNVLHVVHEQNQSKRVALQILPRMENPTRTDIGQLRSTIRRLGIPSELIDELEVEFEDHDVLKAKLTGKIHVPGTNIEMPVKFRLYGDELKGDINGPFRTYFQEYLQKLNREELSHATVEVPVGQSSVNLSSPCLRYLAGRENCDQLKEDNFNFLSYPSSGVSDLTIEGKFLLDVMGKDYQLLFVVDLLTVNGRLEPKVREIVIPPELESILQHKVQESIDGMIRQMQQHAGDSLSSKFDTKLVTVNIDPNTAQLTLIVSVHSFEENFNGKTEISLTDPMPETLVEGLQKIAGQIVTEMKNSPKVWAQLLRIRPEIIKLDVDIKTQEWFGFSVEVDIENNQTVKFKIIAKNNSVINRLEISGLQLQGINEQGIPSIDWSHAKLVTWHRDKATEMRGDEATRALVSALTTLPENMLQVTQSRGSKKGYRFNLAIILNSLNVAVPLGEICFNHEGLCGVERVDFKQHIESLIKKKLEVELTKKIGRDFVIPDFGRITDVKLKVENINLDNNQPFTLALSFWMNIANMLKVHVCKPLYPSRKPTFCRDEIKNKEYEILGGLDSLMGSSSPKIIPNEFNPISVMVSWDAEFIPGFKFSIKDLEINASMKDLSGYIGASLPYNIPIPPVPLYLMEPGMRIDLQDMLNVEFVTDVAFFSETTTDIIKMPVRLGVKTKEGVITLSGYLVLLKDSTVFEVTGDLKISPFESHAMVMSAGIIKSVFDTKAELNLDTNGLKTSGYIKAFGFKLSDFILVIDSKGSITGEGSFKWLSAEATFGAKFIGVFKPEYVRGHVQIGSFGGLPGALKLGLDATLNLIRVEAKAGPLKANLSLPSINSLTPEYVLSLLLAFLDLDLSKLL